MRIHRKAPTSIPPGTSTRNFSGVSLRFSLGANTEIPAGVASGILPVVSKLR